MSISNSCGFFYRDANGIRTDNCVAINQATNAGYNLMSGGTVVLNKIANIDYLDYTPQGVPGASEGRLYYDSAAHKLKIRTAAAWETITSA